MMILPARAHAPQPPTVLSGFEAPREAGSTPPRVNPSRPDAASNRTVSDYQLTALIDMCTYQSGRAFEDRREEVPLAGGGDGRHHPDRFSTGDDSGQGAQGSHYRRGARDAAIPGVD